MTWEFIDRLRGIVKGKLVLKGIMTGEDAKEALRHGVDGLIVSNHGGRAEESGQSTIGVLAEVVDAVGGRIPVLIDGGVRRGTDVLKALALGRHRRRHWPALRVGPRVVRRGRRGPRAADPGRRVHHDHAAGGRAGHQPHHAALRHQRLAVPDLR